MPPTILTRKPANKLTSEDLQTFRIWEYATNEEHASGRDETWVRPVKCEKIPRGAYSQIVAADFTTLAGHKLFGFMIVTTIQNQVEIRPGAVVSPSYHVLPVVSREVAARENYTWSLRDRDALMKAVGAKEMDVFPVCYRLVPLVSGEKSPREGAIP